MRARAWNQLELLACCELYFQVVRAIQAGNRVNKAELIRLYRSGAADLPASEFTGPLSSRTRGSVELRLMNITAALPTVGYTGFTLADHGYRPLQNFPPSLAEVLREYLAERVAA